MTSHFPSEIPLKMMGKSLHKCTRGKKEKKRQQQQHFGTWKTLGQSGAISGNLKKCKPVKKSKKGPDRNPGTSRRCRNWQRCWGTGVTKNRSSVKARLRSSQSPEPLFSCTPLQLDDAPLYPSSRAKSISSGPEDPGTREKRAAVQVTVDAWSLLPPLFFAALVARRMCIPFTLFLSNGDWSSLSNILQFFSNHIYVRIYYHHYHYWVVQEVTSWRLQHKYIKPQT